MIIVKVELQSANTGEITELARMHISNAGGTVKIANYEGQTFIGRSKEALDRLSVHRRGKVAGFRREATHVWNLVARMLEEMGYGR